MPHKILCFGEILWDLLPTENVLGGASLNFANRLCELGDHAFLVSSLGSDELGDAACAELKRLGLPLDWVQVDPNHPTGTVPVTFENGQPRYLITPNVAYDYIEATGEMLSFAAKVDCVYFGTLAQRSPQSHSALIYILEGAKSAVKFLDLNLRKDCYTAESVRSSIAATNILKLNDEECVAVSEMLDWAQSAETEFAKRVVNDFSLDVCVVTLGGKGAIAVTIGNEEFRVSGYNVRVVDTIGAGDAFAAGFVHSYLNGVGIEAALKFGNQLGALAASKKGGTAPIRFAAEWMMLK